MTSRVEPVTWFGPIVVDAELREEITEIGFVEFPGVFQPIHRLREECLVPAGELFADFGKTPALASPAIQYRNHPAEDWQELSLVLFIAIPSDLIVNDGPLPHRVENRY
jgi:hypothetical protein